MCVLLLSGETRNYISVQKERSRLWDRSVLHARKVATEIERQLKENRRLQAEKARQLQIEKDIKEKEAKRHALEKAKIAALIDKHRSCTLSTPDEVNKSGTGINADTNEKEGTERAQPHIRRQQRKATSNHLKTRVQNLIKIGWMHCWVILLLILERIQKRPKQQGKQIVLI